MAKPRASHCTRGHPLTLANLYVDNRGGRQCRECALDRMRARRTTGGSKPVRRTGVWVPPAWEAWPLTMCSELPLVWRSAGESPIGNATL
jgi:hypothetical protein